MVTVLKKMDKLNNEVKKLIENLEKSKKIQIEYDSKNEILKAWELKLHKIDLRSKEWKKNISIIAWMKKQKPILIGIIGLMKLEAIIIILATRNFA